ncbi:MAG TPA: acyltransferase [Polyangiaceae bacterium]|nr:acyltransferase [Polyangiaceae bacterium]
MTRPVDPRPAAESPGNRGFRGIEGARGWLAWAVVVSHLVLLNGANTYGAAFKVLAKLGDWSVAAFVIISGFVITNLLLTKREPYAVYITRRALRIYPAYLLSLAFAVWVSSLTTRVLSTIPWGDPGQIWFGRLQVHEIASGRLWSHLVAHVLLLHGAIPNDVLQQSQFMFLAPAWSLSLEWQFYLIAPMIVAGLRRSAAKIVVFLLFVAGMLAYQWGALGGYDLPSILPGAGMLFLLGIATRLAVDRLPTFDRYPVVPILLCLVVLTAASRNLLPVGLWFAIVSHFRTAPDARGRTAAILRAGLDGRIASAAGDRSYSVYVLHWPLVRLSVFLGYGVLALPRWTIFALSVALVVPAVLLSSELMFRFIERPFIRLGKRAFSSDVRYRAVNVVAPAPIEAPVRERGP